MSKESKGDQLSERDAARRRDEALRRALSTPPTPYKPSGKRKPSPGKRKPVTKKPAK